MRQTRMNTAPQTHSSFFCVAPVQSKMRNGMEEVVGSIPTRSTKSFSSRALSPPSGLIRSAFPDNLKRKDYCKLRRPPPLPPILNAQGISKAFGANPLFEDVSFTVSEGDRIGLIGPNGSGKSTLLRILAGTEVPDSGNLAVRKRLRLSYVEQDSKFEAGESVRSVAERALKSSTA